jgi:purine-cytosine permease-like protein
MPDAELNAKIAELQLQTNGLMAAMTLIEEQSKLRQEDALELSKWKLQAQMHAATEPAPVDSFAFQDPAAPITPPAAAPAVAEKTPEPTISESFEHFPESSSKTVSAPEQIEDIVAALNASYAEVATEPETKQAQMAQVDSTSEVSSNLSSKIEAEPVSAPVTVEPFEENQVTASQSDNQVGANNQDKGGPTRTALALSWSWLAIAASPLALVVAALIKDAGASLSQSVVLLAAVLVITSFMAAVGSMASVRASSSLTIVSRAAFGVWGNALPATLMLFVKLFWAAAFVYFAARIVSPLIFNQPWFADVAGRLTFPGEFTASLFVLIPMIIIAAIVSALGGQGVLRLQQVTAIVTVIGTGTFVYFVASTYSLQDLAAVEAISTSGLIDLGLLAIALFGFAVLSLSGDFARKLPAETPGAKVFFLSFVSTFFLPLITGVLGLLWLFMSEESISASFSAEVLSTVAASAPVWVFVLFVVAVGLSILHLITASLYSLTGNLLGILRIPGWVAALVVSVLVLTGVLIPSYLLAASTLHESVLELVLLAGVVAAAWAGIFVSDALARTRGYHEVSLTREYGFYGKFNFINALGFLLAVALGFGYLNGGPQLSSWTGYLGDLTPEIFELAGSNIGIAMAFGLATLLPVVIGIPRIRKQERNLAELDQRRQELKEFLDATA